MFGEQAQGLTQRRDGGGQINPGASVLPFGFDSFEFDAQAGRQVAFAQAEGLVEETPRLTRQLGAFFCGRQLRTAGFDAHFCGFQIGGQALTFEAGETTSPVTRSVTVALNTALNDPTDMPVARKAVLLAVNHSGDSDSTGAIAGNILGTLLGVKAIPPEWIEPALRGLVVNPVAAPRALVWVRAVIDGKTVEFDPSLPDGTVRWC